MLGLPIFGGIDSLTQTAARERIDVAILALPSASGKTLRRLARMAHDANLRCFTVPSLAELAAGRVTMTALRDGSKETGPGLALTVIRSLKLSTATPLPS